MRNSESGNDSERSYEYLGNIDTFHDWLMQHPKLSSVSQDVWEILFHALRSGEKIHIGDYRIENKSPYITHPIKVVISWLHVHEGEEADPMNVLVLILHDVIEEHPESWKDILEEFGLVVFRDILVLSKLRREYRKEMLRFFLSKYPQLENGIIYEEIVKILSPTDPGFKLYNQSRYQESILVSEAQLIRGAFRIYKKEIIDRDPDKERAEDAYISLGNYLYFTRTDARRKLEDMLHNMGDMKLMEQEKPGYIQKRRIKAYILEVKLKNLGLQHEFTRLQQAFHDAGVSMYTDTEIAQKLGGSL